MALGLGVDSEFNQGSEVSARTLLHVTVWELLLVLDG